MTAQSPYLSPGISPPNPLNQVWEVVVQYSSLDMQNMPPPATVPQQIISALASKNLIAQIGTFSSDISIAGVIIELFPLFISEPLINDISDDS